MARVNQTRPHCVNQMGKTHSKPLAARHGRGTAWAWHVKCESALNLQRSAISYELCQPFPNVVGTLQRDPSDIVPLPCRQQSLCTSSRRRHCAQDTKQMPQNLRINLFSNVNCNTSDAPCSFTHVSLTLNHYSNLQLR